MNRLRFEGSQFYLNNQPFRILSGTIHYFRVVPDYWEDRLLKLKQCGFNTVETYTCWNLHEPREGEFDFSGILDLARFLETASRLGLYVILRPGPYICAEWDMGGLPSWLLTYPHIHLRCHDELFLSKVRRYYKKLFSVIRPYLGCNGGCIIAMQVENEYGSYGDDHTYMQDILSIYEEENLDCLLFTSDGPQYFMLNSGTLPNLLSAVNFGSNPKDNFALLRKFKSDQPLFCCEFWNGWFDHWYEEHHVRGADDTAAVLEEMLDMGASVNLYMFHGGTNFGFTNGANFNDVYQPTVTSYDYNCPLSESGDITPKYLAIQKAVKRFWERHPGEVGPSASFADAISSIGNESDSVKSPSRLSKTVNLTQAAYLFAQPSLLGEGIFDSHPLTMELLGQDFGFVLYQTTLTGPFETLPLTIDGLHDRALIYLDDKLVGIKERTGPRDDEVMVGLDAGQSCTLSILVENMGRINYGPKLLDEKGIVRGVRIGSMNHFGWIMYSIRCNDFAKVNWSSISEVLTQSTIDSVECPHPDCTSSEHSIDNFGPVLLRGFFETDMPCDTFVRPKGFEKGIIAVNGFLLGRYYNSAGPQKTLYLPGPLLKKGKNEFIILELEHVTTPTLLLEAEPDLG